jgi:hypothetical protein
VFTLALLIAPGVTLDIAPVVAARSRSSSQTSPQSRATVEGVIYEWRIVVEDGVVPGPDLLDLGLEPVNGGLLTGPATQDDLLDLLDVLIAHGCTIVSVARYAVGELAS